MKLRCELRGFIIEDIKRNLLIKFYATKNKIANRSPIIQADVVKMFYNESVGRYVTQDSYLSNACDFSRGLCIDASTATATTSSGSGVRYMGSLKTLSFSVIDFRRSFVPSDQHDAPIALDGPTQVGTSPRGWELRCALPFIST